MPKLAPRCSRRGRYGSSNSSSIKLAFLAPPRKVSFEDGHQDEGQQEPNPETPRNMGVEQNTSRSSLSAPQVEALPTLSLKRKSTLIRPTTSQCLVALAESVEDDESMASPQSSAQPQQQLFSAPVSPVPHGSDDLSVESPSAGATTPPTSPWGHFVDIVVPSEERGLNQCASSHLVHDGRCNCCTTCRRRRAGPYGGVYKKTSTSRPLCFLQDNRVRPLLPISSGRNGANASSWRLPSFKLQPSPPRFSQLVPQKGPQHPAEQLVSALHEMRFE